MNHRHEDFQSSALPTELSGQYMKIKVHYITKNKKLLQTFKFRNKKRAFNPAKGKTRCAHTQ